MTDKKNSNTGFEFMFDPDLDELSETQVPEGFDESFGYLNREDIPDTPGVFGPGQDGHTEFLPPDPDKIPTITHAVKQESTEYAQRPAAERTRQLFAQLRTQRIIVHGMIEAAKAPISVPDLEKVSAKLRTKKFSIYDTPTLCSMFETAGAFKRVTEDGSPYEEIKPEPDIVEIDGEQYYEPTYPPAVYWIATPAAFEALDQSGQEERTKKLFEKESDLLAVYKRVLTMINDAGDKGVKITELSKKLDSHPLIAKPKRRFFIQHFTEMLEARDALEWNGSAWTITEYGKKVLDSLKDVVDNYEIPESKFHGGNVAAETDGINW